MGIAKCRKCGTGLISVGPRVSNPKQWAGFCTHCNELRDIATKVGKVHRRAELANATTGPGIAGLTK